ncbi:Fic family protein [Arcanobacterium pinnipediorum]|uniref:Fic family protein n=1 Tax=Arcanobacterium pinnipediorum TaxID=1503041 RepID=A0ABY5AG51_9ACTO|nr:Fic/DOC family N-terminal domain-containing protein [Arcanobacterium pinnipediorum]USR79174.1 Fic family protein [Arcanobacterium pinnipediorum]
MKSFQNLPPLPPEGIETAEVARALVKAARYLARADAAAELIPNPDILIHSIPLLEARASNEIENIVTTNEELFRAAHRIETPSGATREALRYSHALYRGFDVIRERPLAVNTAKLVCSTVIGFEMDIRSNAGTYIGNPTTKERIYTPPEGKDVILDHLSKWESFLHDDTSLDPLVKLALLHYQFEAIHPFSDGNGRTGRILNVLYLVHEGLLRQPITYLSGYIVQHKDEYYRLLNNVTQKNEWIPWVLFMLDAVAVTSQWTSNIIYSIRNQIEDTIRVLHDGGMPARDFAHVLFLKPYLRFSDLTQELNISRPTAGKHAEKLVELGVLERHKVGRNVLFINRQYLDLLFEAKLPE